MQDDDQCGDAVDRLHPLIGPMAGLQDLRRDHRADPVPVHHHMNHDGKAKRTGHPNCTSRHWSKDNDHKVQPRAAVGAGNTNWRMAETSPSVASKTSSIASIQKLITETESRRRVTGAAAALPGDSTRFVGSLSACSSRLSVVIIDSTGILKSSVAIARVTLHRSGSISQTPQKLLAAFDSRTPP